MELFEFKELAKQTGLHLDYFFYSEFLHCFVAECHSKKHPVTIYFPNKFGGATLSTGHGENNIVEFFDSMEHLIENRKEYEHEPERTV